MNVFIRTASNSLVTLLIDDHDTTVPMTTLLAELGTGLSRYRPPVPCCWRLVVEEVQPVELDTTDEALEDCYFSSVDKSREMCSQDARTKVVENKGRCTLTFFGGTGVCRYRPPVPPSRVGGGRK